MLNLKFTYYVSKSLCGLNGQEDSTLTLYVTMHSSHDDLESAQTHLHRDSAKCKGKVKLIYIETALSARAKLSSFT